MAGFAAGDGLPVGCSGGCRYPMRRRSLCQGDRWRGERSSGDGERGGSCQDTTYVSIPVVGCMASRLDAAFTARSLPLGMAAVKQRLRVP